MNWFKGLFKKEDILEEVIYPCYCWIIHEPNTMVVAVVPMSMLGKPMNEFSQNELKLYKKYQTLEIRRYELLLFTYQH